MTMTHQQLTVDPENIAATYQLGGLTATYKPATTCHIIFLSFFGIMGGFVVIFSLFWFFTTSSMLPGPSFFSLFGLIPLLVGLVFIIFALRSVRRTYANRLLRVYVYTDGFAYANHSEVEVMHWQDIQYVRHKVVRSESTSTDSNGHTSTTTHYHHSYTIQGFQGKVLILDETFAGIRQLGKTIEQETARYLSTGAQQAYQAGVTFGPFHLSFNGIREGLKLLPWPEVEKITINENSGSIGIKKYGQLFAWTNVALDSVPNVEVFKALVQQITGGRVA